MRRREKELNAAGADKQLKTAEMQKSVDSVITAAVAGDFTHRAAAEYGYQDLNQFAFGVNELVAAVDRGIAETCLLIAALADGDLSENMKGDGARRNRNGRCFWAEFLCKRRLPPVKFNSASKSFDAS